MHSVARDSTVSAFVLPGEDTSNLLQDESKFDAAEEVFDAISADRNRINFADFAAHFRRVMSQDKSDEGEMRAVFAAIDTDRSGSISKLELVAAMQKNNAVAQFVMPGVDSSKVMQEEWSFDMVSSVFQAISHGKRRIDFADWLAYFQRLKKANSAPKLMRTTSQVHRKRTSTVVLVIGPGQGRGLEASGFQVHFSAAPCPDQPGFPMHAYLGHVRAELDRVQPDAVVAFSSGTAYAVGLWQCGWRGPTVLVNVHPSCTKLPPDCNVVLAHGSNDERYPRAREHLEWLLSTGDPNKSFLLYTANSGQLATGQFSRFGDQHSMESLRLHDGLARLVDAALSPDSPDLYFLRTCRERMTQTRLEAEGRLGYTPEALQKLWASPNQRGLDRQKLFDVRPGSAEFQLVSTVFKCHPREAPTYPLKPREAWDQARIVRVQRVENGTQFEGSIKPYFDSLRTSVEGQDLEFEPGAHTVWGFHGADLSAIESIVENPASGFQPLVSGTKKASLWGSGTYFARDAKYVAEGNFCAPPAGDGTQKMLMCLLGSGMPCLGSPEHRGVLPFRQKPHRYNCSVDSMSSPEIYVIQHPGGAYPAYLITFAQAN
jgi:Ca2+-binding EF-hand superfamily protein